MRVKELIEKLKNMDEDAYILISTDKRFEEDIVSVDSYEDEDGISVVISSL